MLENRVLMDIFVAIAATAFVALKSSQFYRALKLGREEILEGNIRSVIRCLVGRGRTFNKNDCGKWYMILLAAGGGYVAVELIFAVLGLQPPFWPTLSFLLSIIVFACSFFFLVFSIQMKLSRGFWMDMLPILALCLLALNQVIHHAFPGVIQQEHLLYYLVVFFGVGAFPHGLASMVNIYYKNRGPMGKTRPFSLDKGPIGATTVADLPWKSILDGQACANCGRCQNNCPASQSGKRLSPRKIVQKVLSQTGASLKKSAPQSLHEAISAEEIWACSMCMACVKNCPLYIGHVNIILEMRRSRVLQEAQFPVETYTMLRNLELYGDVQGLGAANRHQWALDLRLPRAEEKSNAEYLLWFGCAPEYIPNSRVTFRNMVHILETAKVSFTVLGPDEMCCGDPARRLGEEDIFQNIARKNVEKLNSLGVKKVLTICPHCFNTMKHDYQEFAADFQVLHATELIEQLIDQGRLDFKYGLDKKVTLHDPCYLGRVNNLSDCVRKIIGAVPGMDFKELQRNKTNSFCCGGGGAQMWLHETPGNRMSSLRAEEILATDCQVTATACPYCPSMLGAELQTEEGSANVQFMDVIDMAAYSIGCDCEG